jgi:hypothetical protein
VHEEEEPFLEDYMKDHKSKTNRRLHIIGIGLAVIIFVHALLTFDIFEMIYVPVFGFGFAWIGHYFFEFNKPYTKTDEIIYSIKVNLILIKDIITRKRAF